MTWLVYHLTSEWLVVSENCYLASTIIINCLRLNLIGLQPFNLSLRMPCVSSIPPRPCSRTVTVASNKEDTAVKLQEDVLPQMVDNTAITKYQQLCHLSLIIIQILEYWDQCDSFIMCILVYSSFNIAGCHSESWLFSGLAGLAGILHGCTLLYSF